MSPLPVVLAAEGDPWYVWLYHSALMQVLIILIITIIMQIALNVGVGRVVRSVSARVPAPRRTGPAGPTTPRTSPPCSTTTGGSSARRPSASCCAAGARS